MKLFLFSLISILFVLALADTKACTGPRCKRASNLISKMYNDYDYDYGQRNGGGSNNNQNRDTDCPKCYARNFGDGDYNHNIINIEKK